MTTNLRLKPVLLTRDGVRLAHFEAAPSVPNSPPLVLINGWAGDHGVFAPQITTLPTGIGSSPLTFVATAQVTRLSRNTPHRGSPMTSPGNAASLDCKIR